MLAQVVEECARLGGSLFRWRAAKGLPPKLLSSMFTAFVALPSDSPSQRSSAIGASLKHLPRSIYVLSGASPKKIGLSQLIVRDFRKRLGCHN
jgi:hypothetical protein